ncbi:PHYTOCHROME KINASE SUBSTRATE 4 [Spatholobus suberectus]|nr:PHYTOCHROME KINASE SUBSTRATE 4 [Spatholobus suberectus]
MERVIAMKKVRDRDASFSSYLRPDNKATITGEDSTTELSIFDAHKYFNDDNNNNNNIQKVSISRVSPMERIPETGDVIITEPTRYSSASSSVDGYAHIRNYRARSFHAATPTASSEASWNSQTGLLSHPPGAIPVSMKNPQNPKIPPKPIWTRKCPCRGKKSVQVKESTQESKSNTPPQDYEHHSVRNHVTPNNWILNQTLPAPIPAPATATIVAAKSQRFHNANSHKVVSSVRLPLTDGFTFPVLNPNNSITKLKLANGVVEEDPPRDSLEVFRPPDEPSPKPLGFPSRRSCAAASSTTTPRATRAPISSRSRASPPPRSQPTPPRTTATAETPSTKLPPPLPLPLPPPRGSSLVEEAWTKVQQLRQ